VLSPHKGTTALYSLQPFFVKCTHTHTYTHTAPFMPDEVKKQFHPSYSKLHFTDVLSPQRHYCIIYFPNIFVKCTHTHNTHTHTTNIISSHVGGSGDCTVNLINHGIGDMVSIEFAGTGDASYHTCQIDRQQRTQCKSVNSWL